MNITELKWDQTIDASTIAILQTAFDGRLFIIAIEPDSRIREIRPGRLVVIGNEHRHADLHLRNEEFALAKDDPIAFRECIALPILKLLDS